MRMIDDATVRYLMVGVANTGVGFGCILLLQEVLGATPVLANAGGYALGLAVSYVLTRSFAFRSSHSHARSLPAFLASAGVCYALNLLALHVALRVLGAQGLLPQTIAAIVYTVSFYLLNRYVVFARSHA